MEMNDTDSDVGELDSEPDVSLNNQMTSSENGEMLILMFVHSSSSSSSSNNNNNNNYNIYIAPLTKKNYRNKMHE